MASCPLHKSYHLFSRMQARSHAKHLYTRERQNEKRQRARKFEKAHYYYFELNCCVLYIEFNHDLLNPCTRLLITTTCIDYIGSERYYYKWEPVAGMQCSFYGMSASTLYVYTTILYTTILHKPRFDVAQGASVDHEEPEDVSELQWRVSPPRSALAAIWLVDHRWCHDRASYSCPDGLPQTSSPMSS